MKTESYTIVATTFNDEDGVCDLLYDIDNQTIKPYEVIIVDGGSNDKTCEIIEKSDLNIRLIKGKRLNISQGLNAGIKEATTDFIGIVAVGNRYKENFFCELMKKMKNDEADCTFSYLSGNRDTWFARLYSDFFMVKSYGIATNHGVLLKKEIFEKCGYFYESFYYAGEDAEYFRRLKRYGIKMSCVEKEMVVWDSPKKLKEYFKQQDNRIVADMQLFSNDIFIRFHRNHLMYGVGVMLLLVASVMAFFYAPLLALCFICVFLVFNLILALRLGLRRTIARNIQCIAISIYTIKNLGKINHKIDNNLLVTNDE